MRLLSILLCLILLAWALPTAAQNPIERCVGANGSPVFTDQPCAALQATALAPAAKPKEDNSQPLEPPPILCAATRDELRQSVIDAFANHDANRLAGLMLWNGYGHGAAVADIRELGSLVKRPLLDLGPTRDPAPAAADSSADPLATAASAAAPASNQLVLQTAGNDGSGDPRELRFDIVRHAGCLWLRNTD
jgi:hypothetical protein